MILGLCEGLVSVIGNLPIKTWQSVKLFILIASVIACFNTNIYVVEWQDVSNKLIQTKLTTLLIKGYRIY